MWCGEAYTHDQHLMLITCLSNIVTLLKNCLCGMEVGQYLSF